MKNSQLVRERIVSALISNKLERDISEDIAFHMTDWQEDLLKLIELNEKIEFLSNEEIRKVLIGFLAHVPNHVAAARKLIGLGPIDDIFNVGVFEEDH